MKLAELLSIYPMLSWGNNPEREVKQLSFDSRHVDANTVFIAIQGEKSNGHDFLEEVCSKKAAAIIIEGQIKVPDGYSGAVVRVNSTREELHRLAAHFYRNPAEDMYCVGVTGTNGKTSITFMVETILNAYGWLTGVLGTVDHHIADKVWQSQLTTPDPITLHKRLSEFKILDAKAVAFEVSSHALMQKRVDSIPFDAVVFTNLTRDHLDYHQTMENYFAAKETLFKTIPLNSKNKKVHAVINGDDPYGRKITTADAVQVWMYGQQNCDLQFSVLKSDFSGSIVHLKTPRGEKEFKIPLVGLHNVYNAVAAIGVGLSANVSLDTCCKAMETFMGVPGRLERIANRKDLNVFIDYAHTDDALNVVLKALTQINKAQQKQSRMITVFGCGGDRDKGKRPLMGKAAATYSDLIIVTNDNPRTENPEAIAHDILAGIDKKYTEKGSEKKVFIELDRESAIKLAIDKAQKDDVILIAGKGHEDYQIIGTTKHAMSDKKMAQAYLKG